jgi:F0F1-type ATP synthase membrane subunit c/vacuolar-type H+-ATPase subunit K
VKFVFAAIIVVMTTVGCSGGEGDSVSKSDEAAAKQAQADAKAKFSQLTEQQKQQLKQAMAKSPGNAN